MNTSSPVFIPVILAGGKGERFWPLSRRQRPKQFLSLDGSGVSLLQATAQRLLSLAGDWENLWVITAAPIAEGVFEQLPSLPRENCLVEPEGKDTAPAVAWASLEIAQQYGDDAIIGFFPADHWIKDQCAYEQTLKAAIAYAQEQDAIVTLGIKPNGPATGYGYIEQDILEREIDGLPVYQVTRFTEKPDRATAQTFVDSGKFSWNSGMFIFRAGVVLRELDRHAPELLATLRAKGAAGYPALEKKSIDYVLMEKTQLAYVLPANFGWDDLGDWNALERLFPDAESNVDLAKHVNLHSRGCIVYASDENQIIATIGLKDVVIVREGNVTLVVPKDHTQDIKDLLKQLQSQPEYKNLL
ncbi:mannose-1-phosphate guanylyltransferase [Synechocystis sp. CACIAM 05]|uniref:mannose-1-phosphate guanylyltransferase n=1 Tax=Synechocystis sp. CACIAM 05 TaxID=1933929 RepID=UPI00138E5A06|nr:mannose-1-phosphate guanylyltransferase [Synechocystis sp. CACIAM 05]QHV00190.1 mannose-1-phosphate guanylyltransferase [Synechocystis sp. CACIAM 05]